MTRSSNSQKENAPAVQSSKPAYKRIVIKLSGEALREPGGTDNISPAILHQIALQIKAINDLGVQTAVVIGGGNIWRGLSASHRGMERTTADHMGMLATVINCLAIQSQLEQLGVETRVQTAIPMEEVAEPFILRRAIRHLEKGRVVIFGAGIGSPYFSTDTTAALRASEIKADLIIKATKVDGVYDSDPAKNADAVKYDTLTFREAFSRELKILDSTAFALCMENKVPIRVLCMTIPNNIQNAILGENVGTLVDE